MARCDVALIERNLIAARLRLAPLYGEMEAEMLRRIVLGLGLAAATALAPGGWRAAEAAGPAPASAYRFAALEGGEIDLASFRGKPVLVVNTASRCGFVGQFEELQALYDRYRDRGLTVLGVPSDSFKQELSDAEAVKEFCEVNFSIDFPMTAITPVTGRDAHPFYAWAREQGAAPSWNFHKILLDGDGRILGAWGPMTAPDAPKVVAAIEAALPR
jgi:glutathione peroxidase